MALTKSSRSARGGKHGRFRMLSSKKPEKALVRGKSKKSGRNNFGRITVRHHGGGHKRRYRLIDFKRDKKDVPARAHSIEYDPNRSCHIALLYYRDGAKSYILAPEGLKPGDEVVSGDGSNIDIKTGNALPLAKIPSGSEVHNIEMQPGGGGRLVRSAGAKAVVLGFAGKRCQVKMPSGEVRLFLSACRATIGSAGHGGWENIRQYKAGRNRWRGKRPSVRGMAMNPVDHPLGGGEGVGKGNHPMTPWGKSCKGLKTRNNRRTDKMIISRRKRRE